MIKYTVDENINGWMLISFIKFIKYGIATLPNWLSPSDTAIPVDFIYVGNDYVCSNAINEYPNTEHSLVNDTTILYNI